jgi:hypothetical protein
MVYCLVVLCLARTAPAVITIASLVCGLPTGLPPVDAAPADRTETFRDPPVEHALRPPPTPPTPLAWLSAGRDSANASCRLPSPIGWPSSRGLDHRLTVVRVSGVRTSEFPAPAPSASASPRGPPSAFPFSK